MKYLFLKRTIERMHAGAEAWQPGAPQLNPPNCISSLIQVTLLVQTILIFVFRGSHTGYVCSGTYLTEKEKADDRYMKYVDIGRGEFLFVIMIINAIFLILGCLCCLCTACLVSGAAGLYASNHI